MNNITPSVSIKNASLHFKYKTIFENLNLSLDGGKITCLLGHSGAGKSCLLRLIAGLYKNSTDIFWSADIACSDHQDISNRIAYMAQQDLLMPWLTVLENVLLSVKFKRQLKNLYSLKNRAMEILERTGLAHVANDYPTTLSIGMRQRAALARTLIEDKPIILMDEPFAALDVGNRLQMQNLVCELLQHRTVLFVTHDPLEALRIGHHYYLLSEKPTTLTKEFSLLDAIPRDITQPETLQRQGQLISRLINDNKIFNKERTICLSEV